MAKLRTLIRNLALLAVLAAGIACVVYNTRPITLTHATRNQCPRALPADATDISYYDPGLFAPFTFASFTTTEASFLAWTKTTTRRPLTLQTGEVRGRFFDIASHHSQEIKTTDGLYFSWSEADRSEHFLFDRLTSRAYYQVNTR